MTGPAAPRRPRPRPGPAAAPQPAAGEVTGAVAGQPPRDVPMVVLAAGYLIFVLAGALCAIFEVLLVPTRWGGSLVPLAPLLALLSNTALPTISRNLTGTTSSAVPPVLGWFVATFALTLARPEGDVLLPAGPIAWVSYSLLGVGTLAAIGTLTAGDRPAAWMRRRLRARSDSDSGGAR